MASFGLSRKWQYQIDVARDGAGRLVKHMNKRGRMEAGGVEGRTEGRGQGGREKGGGVGGGGGAGGRREGGGERRSVVASRPPPPSAARCAFLCIVHHTSTYGICCVTGLLAIVTTRLPDQGARLLALFLAWPRLDVLAASSGECARRRELLHTGTRGARPWERKLPGCPRPAAPRRLSSLAWLTLL